nr:hypothetical protein [Asgard group archaeon]
MSINKMNFKDLGAKRIFAIILLTTSFLLPIIMINLPMNFGTAHSAIAEPIEIFSLWNDTAPTIDGTVGFHPYDLSAEWSSAAVYNMYDDTGSPTSKLILQNDDTNLYIGFDMTDYTVQNPSNPWVCAVYMDRDHNGILTEYDRVVFYYSNNTANDYVLLYQYNPSSDTWDLIEWELPGTLLPVSNILIDTDFTSSYFEASSHRQYEIRIPLSFLKVTLGNVTGIGFESFDNYWLPTGSITWPVIDTVPADIWKKPSTWGDLHIGSSANSFVDYVVEDNFNIEIDSTTRAIGYNNMTFLTTGDINGDGKSEIIVGSNRSITGESKLLFIYNFTGTTLNTIWRSIDSTHSANIIRPLGITTYDYDSNGEDEVYIVSNGNSIIRLYNWNETSSDFDNLQTIIPNAGYNYTGFIDFGDANNDGIIDMITGTIAGNVILTYSTNNFQSLSVITLSKATLLGNTVSKIQAIDVANMDSDADNEIIYAGQITTDDSLGTAAIQILEKTGVLPTLNDNSEDDLPLGSSSTTQDDFIHTILTGDVDNDGSTEIIIVGQDYIRVFGPYTFTDPSPPLEILVNTTTLPNISGGAAIGDIDNDLNNELIFGAANGTIYILTVIDSGVDDLSYTVDWSSDFGHSPGYKKSMTILDRDGDSENELIYGDDFGQIMVLGKSESPAVTITYPTSSTVATTDVELRWSAVDDFTMHHFDLSIEGIFEARLGGSMRGIDLSLPEGQSTINITGFDITGKNDSAIKVLDINLDAPEVEISDPEDNSYIGTSTYNMQFSYYDRDGNFNHYEIYVNSSTPIESNWLVNNYLVSFTDAGKYNITIVAIDDDDYTGKAMITVYYDPIPPVVNILYLTDGSFVNSQNLLLQWSATDNMGLDHFIIYKDGSPINQTTATDTDYWIPLELDTTYLLKVEAYDLAGKMGEASVSITKDSIKPTVQIISPLNLNYTTQSSIILQWSSTDNFGGSTIDHTEVRVNGVLKYSDNGQQANITLGSNGVKDIVVTTFDKA